MWVQSVEFRGATSSFVFVGVGGGGGGRVCGVVRRRHVEGDLIVGAPGVGCGVWGVGCGM